MLIDRLYTIGYIGRASATHVGGHVTVRRAPLTDQQSKVYGFIVEFWKDHNFPPTMREIQQNFNYKSNNSVAAHIKKLREKGYITNASGDGHVTARSIQLVDNIVGNHIIKTEALRTALAKMKAKGEPIGAGTAIELLSLLNIRVY